MLALFYPFPAVVQGARCGKQVSQYLTIAKYSRISVARTLMVRLTGLTGTHSWVPMAASVTGGR